MNDIDCVEILTLKALITIAADPHLSFKIHNFYNFFRKKIRLDISYEADDSHKMSRLIFSEKITNQF